MARIKTIPTESDHVTYLTPLSENRRSQFNRDRTSHVAPCHIPPLIIDRDKIQKNQFFIPKNPEKVIKNLEKFRKNIENSLKIRKFITFKIYLQINPNFFHLIRNLSIYHSIKLNLINN